MTIRELQLEVVKLLNGVEALVQGGCTVFAEDVRETYDEVGRCVSEGGIAVVVVTPRLERSGDSAAGIPADTRLLVRCIEHPAVARESPDALRALDAAEAVMRTLDGARFCWLEIDQSQDPETGVVTATATFATTITL